MATYDLIAELPLRIDSLSLEGREMAFGPEFVRKTTLIQLPGDGKLGVSNLLLADDAFVSHANNPCTNQRGAVPCQPSR